MSEHKVSPEFIARFRNYLSSEEFGKVPDYSKTEYWQYHSRAIDIAVSDNSIAMRGQSGFYVPPTRNVIKRIVGAVKSPSSFMASAKRRWRSLNPEIGLMNYFKAFEKVMNNDPITDPVLSPYRIDFKALRSKKGAVVSIKEMRKDFFLRHEYKINYSVIMAYYIYNILNGYIELKNIRTVLEIGAGNGTLAALLRKKIDKLTYVIVDLPETICLSMVFLKELFPDAKILMPHEKRVHGFNEYDFIFLTPEQINVLDDNCVDLAINNHSFQEMSHKQVAEYFKLIQRCSKRGAYFYTANRVEKIPSGPDNGKETLEPPQRFSDYPWVQSNKVLVHEICRLMRLVQLDNIYVHLERIEK